VFPVEQGTVLGAKQFHRAGRDVLSRDGATLWVTPQGRFVDPRDRDVSFAAGLAGLVAADLGCQVVPMAIEYPFWGERLPEVLVRFGDPVVASDLPRGRRERSEFLRARLADAQGELATSARRRDPAEFHSLLAGRAGVGGVYDGWRRAIAALRGERFVAAHMPAERADDESARGVAW
jgi:1-acyl-sn-glycerol-3-phosphate acyltransferase